MASTTTLLPPPVRRSGLGAAPDETTLIPKKLVRARPLFDPEILRRALKDSVLKLNPVTLMKNPGDLRRRSRRGAGVAVPDPRHRDRRGRDRIRAADRPVALVHRALRHVRRSDGRGARQGAGRVAAQDQDRHARQPAVRQRADREGLLVEAAGRRCRGLSAAGEVIPGDGEVIDGIATVDESVITGESAPVIRESGGDRSAVTGGTRVLSDQIKIKITSNPGETFLDRMIALVEGAERQKTPNEIALNILIAGLTIIFLLAVATLVPYAIYSVNVGRRGHAADDCRLCRAAGLPDSDDDWRTALGDRHRRHGPRDAAQRAGDERQGGRGRRRREHAAARQDRHHHARQPAGGGVPAGGGRHRRRTGGCRAVVQPGRRNAGRALDRRARQGKIRPARPRGGRAQRASSSRSRPTRR